MSDIICTSIGEALLASLGIGRGYCSPLDIHSLVQKRITAQAGMDLGEKAGSWLQCLYIIRLTLDGAHEYGGMAMSDTEQTCVPSGVETWARRRIPIQRRSLLVFA